MSKKEWLVYGLLLIGELVFFWQGVFDASHVLRVTIGIGVYILTCLGMRLVNASKDAKGIIEAAVLSLLLVWILGASWPTALWISALTGIRFFIDHSKRD